MFKVSCKNDIFQKIKGFVGVKKNFFFGKILMCDIIMDDKNSLTMVNVECDVKITSRQISQEGAHELKAD
jgi:hypothetical protein